MFDRLLEAAKSIEVQGDRASAMAHIAAAEAEAGNPRKALKIVTLIDHSGYRGIALCNVAVAQAKAGDLPHALQTARSIQESKRRANALYDIGTLQIEAGRMAVIAEIAGDIDSKYGGVHASLQRNIAAAHAKAGDFTVALEIANRIDHPWYWHRAQALGRIAGVQYKTDKPTVAATTLQSAVDAADIIGSSRYREHFIMSLAIARNLVLEDIVASQVDAGNFRGARDIVKLQKYPNKSLICGCPGQGGTVCRRA